MLFQQVIEGFDRQGVWRGVALDRAAFF